MNVLDTLDRLKAITEELRLTSERLKASAERLRLSTERLKLATDRLLALKYYTKSVPSYYCVLSPRQAYC